MKLTTVFMSIITCCFAEPSWYSGKLEGWYYFQEKENQDDAYGADEALAIVDEEKTQHQEALSLALISPTKENIENYLSESKRQIDRSAKFAEACDQALSEKNKIQAMLKQLGDTHFLLLCFRGRDPLSSQAAVTARTFSEKNGWIWKALSLDGLGTEGIDTFEIDQGISSTLGLDSTPSFFAIDPEKNQAIPIATRLLSVAELEQNLLESFTNE